MVEILAYLFPYVDNLLTTASVPVSAVVGILATAAVMTEVSPVLQWALAIIAGGGAATATSFISAGIHNGSTAVTGGFANPVLSAVESIAAGFMSILAIVAPLLALICLFLVFLLLYKVIVRLRKIPA